jgi:uncharacterized protein YegJ (DUF2314 family)
MFGCDKSEPAPKAVPPPSVVPQAQAPLPDRIPGNADPAVTLPQTLDEQLTKAREDALAQWSRFEESFRNPPRFSQHSVKVAMPVKGVTDGETHQVWVWVTAIEGDEITGKLANDPAKDIGLRPGDRVTLKKSDIQDWLIFTPPSTQVGGFSVKVIQEYEKSDLPPK